MKSSPVSPPLVRTAPQRVYHHRIWDSRRWSGIELRPGDIIIATGYRAGTTWMQRICSLLIFQQTELASPLQEYSTWVELDSEPAQQVWRRYANQEHRRFFKTHTPLDGLPYRSDVDYVFVGRDPRDVAVSLWHHLANMPDEDEREPLAPDFSSFLRTWLSVGAMDGDTDGYPYWSYFSHAQSYWDQRQLDNLHMFHFGELELDLGGQMRRLARLLGIEVPASRWPALIEAASFRAMKSRSSLMTPSPSNWKNGAAFFNRGTSGQWREQFGDADLRGYRAAVVDKLPVELSRWLHRPAV